MEITWSNIIGKVVLIGLTYIDAEDNIIERKQYYGKVVNADSKTGIYVQIDNIKEPFCLPPDLSSMEIATPGKYILHSTGEEVVNPDLLSTWTIQQPE